MVSTMIWSASPVNISALLSEDYVGFLDIMAQQGTVYMKHLYLCSSRSLSFSVGLQCFELLILVEHEIQESA
jgi:hypothetical protein